MQMHLTTQRLALTALFAALTAVGAFLQIPTFWGVSFTLQVLIVLLGAVLLGPQCGCLSQVIYLLLGLFGLPIFTGGGGFAYVLRPSFGFMLSWPFAAILVGLLTKEDRSRRRIVLSCIAGLSVIYAIGLPYMAVILNIYMDYDMAISAIVWSGMLLYLPADALKIAAVAVISPPLLRALEQMSRSHR